MVVTAALVRLLGKKLDTLREEVAVPDPMLVTRLPMPTQKAMMSPANRPTMAPCQRHGRFSCQQANSPNLDSNSQKHPVHGTVEADVLLTGGLAQGKNIPRQKSPSNGPPTMPKILSAAWKGQVRKKE